MASCFFDRQRLNLSFTLPTGYLTVKTAPSKQHRKNRVASHTQKTLLPLVAVGGSLAGLPASALELGDLTVQSNLGQPLRASIAYVLAPNEQLADSCVTLGAGASASGLPNIGRAAVSIAEGSILLTGKAPMREPMAAASIVVDCAYTASLEREYMVFLDPASSSFNEQATAETAPVAPAAPARQSASARPSTAAPRRSTRTTSTVKREPIGASTRYRVQPGDSLSRIAERIENRSIGLWSAVDVIFESNPDAFIDDDPNKLKAGSWLTIPSLDGSEPVVAAAPPSRSASTQSAAQDIVTQVSTSAESAPIETSAAVTVDAQEAGSDASADLSPANVVGDTDNPFVDGLEVVSDDVVIPDTELDGPITVSDSPNVPTAVINTSTQASTTSWLMWLTGGGIAIIIGLLLFGRLLRARPSDAIADQPTRRATDEGSVTVEALPPLVAELDDDSPTEENLSLDADLIVGTGLQASGDMDVAQDFGFASPTELDIELPFEPEASTDTAETIALTEKQASEETILESEVLPDDEDYDLSVILDATKMPQPEDVTQQDLQAVEVPAEDETAISGSYTINKEVDLDILEQDYEDELTATQALNAEIARAAAGLIGNNKAEETEDEDENEDETDAWMTTRETVAMPPLATVTELDATAQMPSGEEVVEEESDEDFLVETATVVMTDDDATAEMPAADNDDETADMELDGGKVDTKAV